MDNIPYRTVGCDGIIPDTSLHVKVGNNGEGYIAEKTIL